MQVGFKSIECPQRCRLAESGPAVQSYYTAAQIAVLSAVLSRRTFHFTDVLGVWHHIAADPSALVDFESDLRSWLYQLRSLVPPSIKVSNFLGGSSWQHRISACEPIGPFADKDELHRFLLSRVWCDEREAIIANALKSFGKPHHICFTHGELRPHNLLMLNERLSGLVDWETAGWFPEYWDYIGGCYIVPPTWARIFHGIFSQYEHELEVDDEIGNVPSAHPMAG